MKIICENYKDAILLKELTPTDYIIVGYIGGNPVILTPDTNLGGKYSFRSISGGITYGEGYSSDTGFKDTLTEYKEEELQAFKNKDWKEALQWLIDNA